MRSKCEIAKSPPTNHRSRPCTRRNIGTVDESGIAKSGSSTAGAVRQYHGNRGKVENCIVGVHLGYSTPEFHTLLVSQLYLPEEQGQRSCMLKKTTSSMKSNVKTKKSHTKTRTKFYLNLGIDVDKIKSCIT